MVAIANLHIPGTTKTPDILFDPEIGNFEIKGRSIPENSVAFYSQILHWLDEYERFSNGTTQLSVKLEYFNTSSARCLIDVFRRLEKLHQIRTQVEVHWYYESEDDDMKEAGEDFRNLIKIPVILHEVSGNVSERTSWLTLYNEQRFLINTNEFS